MIEMMSYMLSGYEQVKLKSATGRDVFLENSEMLENEVTKCVGFEQPGPSYSACWAERMFQGTGKVFGENFGKCTLNCLLAPGVLSVLGSKYLRLCLCMYGGGTHNKMALFLFKQFYVKTFYFIFL